MIPINITLEKLLKKLLKNRSFRRTILILIDLLIIYFSFIFTYWITDDFKSIYENKLFLNILLINGFILFILTGQYKGITKFSGSKSIYFLVMRVFSLIFLVST